jgi:hypothetical protein
MKAGKSFLHQKDPGFLGFRPQLFTESRMPPVFILDAVDEHPAFGCSVIAPIDFRDGQQQFRRLPVALKR